MARESTPRPASRAIGPSTRLSEREQSRPPDAVAAGTSAHAVPTAHIVAQTEYRASAIPWTRQERPHAGRSPGSRVTAWCTTFPDRSVQWLVARGIRPATHMHHARRLQLQGQPRHRMAEATLTAFPFKLLAEHRCDHADPSEERANGEGVARAISAGNRRSCRTRSKRRRRLRSGRRSPHGMAGLRRRAGWPPASGGGRPPPGPHRAHRRPGRNLPV